jgi:hypothetical protein
LSQFWLPADAPYEQAGEHRTERHERNLTVRREVKRAKSRSI